MPSERRAYIYVQLPGTLNTVLAALLKVESLSDGTFVGRFRYGGQWRATHSAEAYWLAPEPPRLARSSALLGRSFRSADGDLGGTLADVVLDAHEGNVVFAVAFTLGAELVLQLDARRLERERDFGMRELEERLADADFLKKTAAYADRLAAALSRP